MAFGCGTAANRQKWCIAVLLATVGMVCMLLTGPVYVGTLAHNPQEFSECAECVQDFVSETLHSVDVNDIAHKIEKIHDRNQEQHLHPKGGDPDDECITKEDIDDLLPDLKNLHFPDFKKECKAVCTPVMKMIPLAVAKAGIMFLVGALCFVGTLIALCLLCCCNKGGDAKPQVYYYYHAAPSAHPGSPHPVGQLSVPTGIPADEAKMPLLAKP